MKKCIAFLICVFSLFNTAYSENVLRDGWDNASISELETARDMISSLIESRQALPDGEISISEESDDTENNQSNDIQTSTEASVLYSENGILILWNGLVDTHTSGLDFQPDLYIENNSSDVLSIRPSEFYANGIRMSPSNSGSIDLDPKTRIMLSTRNSWLLSASDLIDVYGCDTIENFLMKLTIKCGDQTLEDERPFSIDTKIDIFELMGTNSYFVKKYSAE